MMTPGSSSLLASPTTSTKASPLMSSGGKKRKAAVAKAKSKECTGKHSMSTEIKVDVDGVKGDTLRKISPTYSSSPEASGKTFGKKVGAASAPKMSAKKDKIPKNSKLESETDAEDSEVSFEDYSELCERFAKTMYYADPKLPRTPRPSLPLTILAVDTFSKYARKDTLDFLDTGIAAEIGRQACVSPTALVFALVYLERLSLNNPGYLKTIKPSELFVVSLLVASKFVQDDGEDLGIFNDEWATSANMELEKLNQLELEFLSAVDWRINVGKDEYEKCLENIEEKVALYQGSNRGWFTYTELKSLTNSHLLANSVLPILTHRITEVVSAICVMYTTFFATLMTSSVLAPYILSLSKMVLTSAGSSSLLVESSLSSCLQDISLQNASLSLSQDILGDGTSPTTNIQRFVPSGQWLPGVDDHDQENSTENDIAFSERLKQQINDALHQHRRLYQTTTGNNYGYSFKCESNCQRHYSDDEGIANVQRILESLLQSSNFIKDENRKDSLGFPCLDIEKCHESPLLQQLQSRRLKVE